LPGSLRQNILGTEKMSAETRSMLLNMAKEALSKLQEAV
jgi:hypothetical protein